MSCNACEKAQTIILNTLTGLDNATYIRVGSSNILISGCDKHLKELINLYRKALKP